MVRVFLSVFFFFRKIFHEVVRSGLMSRHREQFVVPGLGHLAPKIGCAGRQTLLSLSDGSLRELNVTCLEVVVVRILEYHINTGPVTCSARVEESAIELTREERSEDRDDKEETSAELEGGRSLWTLV